MVGGPARHPHLPGLLHEGLDERKLVWICAEAPSERMWVTEQLIKSNAAGAIVAWLPQARQEQLRRLQVCDDALRDLATWALQLTPRVAVSADAVIMEVEASLRLFGGHSALRDRVVDESRELGVGAFARAPTSLAAIAFARAGREDGLRVPLGNLLDALPMETLGAVVLHLTTLPHPWPQYAGPHSELAPRRSQPSVRQTAARRARPGVRTPARGPCLDRASRDLQSSPRAHGARRLLIQMCGWLAARYAGTTSFGLRWVHDSMRSREIADRDEVVMRRA